MKIATLMQYEQYNTVKSGLLNLVLDHWVRDVVYLFLKSLKYSVGAKNHLVRLSFICFTPELRTYFK